jgi:hypothetical protein
MASSSIAAALALPEVVAAVDAFNELLPGVQTSKENLLPLWDYLMQLAANGDSYVLRDSEWLIRVGIYERKGKNPGILQVAIEGPIEPEVPFRSVIDWRRMPATIDNLAEVLAWGKQVAQRVREGDFCDRCDGEAPVKKLRARPLPFCARCSMDVSLGAPAVKRRRGE